MKILYGICGIGNGHTYRQLPILSALAENGADIVLFAYDTSFRFYSKLAERYPKISVHRVAVPYYQGCETGLDFEVSALLECNRQDFFGTNAKALSEAQKKIGTPDLVISDYEPVCAQYAYAHDAPLITIDQQSKYLTEQFPAHLNGTSYRDEVQRLRLFFPKATMRIACSFFRVSSQRSDLWVCPPVLRDAVKELRRNPIKESILVYLSAQQFEIQSIAELLAIFGEQTTIDFHVFFPQCDHQLQNRGNIYFYGHGDRRFDQLLASCGGIISTAGHSLLSEAMHLGIPVLALPLALYEQQMNASIIKDNGFGLSTDRLNREVLSEFLDRIPEFENAIQNDHNVLFCKDALPEILQRLSLHSNKTPSAITNITCNRE
jgi:uncharacterized protein (TIGR00661 family)